MPSVWRLGTCNQYLADYSKVENEEIQTLIWGQT